MPKGMPVHAAFATQQGGDAYAMGANREAHDCCARSQEEAGRALAYTTAAIVALAIIFRCGAPLAQAQLQSLVDEIVVTTAAANKPKKPATGAGAGANVLANRASLQKPRPIPGAPGA